MNNISKLSEKFKQKYLTTTDIFDLLSEDISKELILKFLEDYKGNDLEIPTQKIYEFICENKNLSQKCMNSILNEDVKLFLRIRNHEESGTWYSDNYTPYCCQNKVKCSGPRMKLMDYGYKCPECKNEISFIGIRLNESPLNINEKISELSKNILLAADEIANYQLFGKTKKINFYNIKIYKEPTNNELDKLISEISIKPKDSEPNNKYGKIIIADDIDNNQHKNLFIDIHNDEAESKIRKYYLANLNFPIIIPQNIMSPGPDKFKPTDYQIQNQKNIVNFNSFSVGRNIGKLKAHNEYLVKIKFKEKMEQKLLNKNDELKEKAPNAWVSLKEILEILPDAFNIDTRDFYCINISSRKWSQEQKIKFTKIFENFSILIKKYPKRFDYTSEEIKTILTDLKEKSGNDCEWRMLSFSNFEKETNNWQLKYMEVIRISDNQFIIVHYNNKNDEPTLIKKEILTSEINIELLNAH